MSLVFIYKALLAILQREILLIFMSLIKINNALLK